MTRELTDAQRAELRELKNLDEVKAYAARAEAQREADLDRECMKTCKSEMCTHTGSCWWRA